MADRFALEEQCAHWRERALVAEARVVESDEAFGELVEQTNAVIDEWASRTHEAERQILTLRAQRDGLAQLLDDRKAQFEQMLESLQRKQGQIDQMQKRIEQLELELSLANGIIAGQGLGC